MNNRSYQYYVLCLKVFWGGISGSYAIISLKELWFYHTSLWIKSKELMDSHLMMHHRFTTGMLYEEFNTDMKNYLTIVIYQHKQLIHIKLIFNCETLFFFLYSGYYGW